MSALSEGYVWEVTIPQRKQAMCANCKCYIHEHEDCYSDGYEFYCSEECADEAILGEDE